MRNDYLNKTKKTTEVVITVMVGCWKIDMLNVIDTSIRFGLVWKQCSTVAAKRSVLRAARVHLH
jgi:hypothetical protein